MLHKKYGINTWGRGLWHFIHTATFNYPEYPMPYERRAIKRFLRSLTHLMPCRKCKDDFRKYVKSIPTRSRAELSRYMVHVHNLINMKLGKKTVSYKEAEEMFAANPAKQHPSRPTCSSCQSTQSRQRAQQKVVRPWVIGVSVTSAIMVVGIIAVIAVALRVPRK